MNEKRTFSCMSCITSNDIKIKPNVTFFFVITIEPFANKLLDFHEQVLVQLQVAKKGVVVLAQVAVSMVVKASPTAPQPLLSRTLLTAGNRLSCPDKTLNLLAFYFFPLRYFVPNTNHILYQACAKSFAPTEIAIELD